MPYDFEVTQGATPVPFNGRQYAPGDHFTDDDPCRAKQFLAAYRAANPKRGMQGFGAVTDELDQKCPMIVTDTGAQPSAFDTPTEADPITLGGDSPAHQGAPAPPVGGILTGTTNPTAAPAPVPLGEEPRRPASQEPHPTSTTDKPQAKTAAGEPVDLFSGAFSLDETDLEIPSTILPLAFVRSYRSGTPAFGPFGWNWDHNFNLYVRELSNGDVGLWRGLREERFTVTGAAFEPPRGVFERLGQPAGAPQVYDLTGAGGGVLHFERPAGWSDADRIPVLRLRDRHGNTLAFAYDTENRLIEVRDDDDRFFAFTYDACGLLVTVTDHTGRRYLYEHDEETMHLVRATSPAITDHPGGLSRYYFYEESSAPPELRHNLLRIADADGNVFVENTYESDPSSWSYGRVTSQYMGAYLFQFCSRQLQLVPPNPVHINIPAVAVEVLNPELGLETYTFNYRGDLLDRRYRLNKDGSFRVVVWQYEFDAAGNMTVVTRPDGSQELTTYDVANPDARMRGKILKRELTSASGFPAPSRILWTGKYEPSYQLLIEETGERGEVTTYRFDFDLSPGNPANSGLLREVIHPLATLPDGTKQHAVTKYEWNAKGQLTARVCPDGVRTELHYGTAGSEQSRLVKIVVDVGGLNTASTLAYDTVGFDSRWTDANNNDTQYVFNALGLIERAVLPSINGTAAEFRLHYNIDKRVCATERPRGTFDDAVLAGAPIVDRFDLDVLGYRTSFILSSNTAQARTLRFGCDFRGVPVRITNPDGSRIHRVYDERGLQVRETLVGADGATLTSKRSYNRTGTLRQEISTAGDITAYEYDGFGRLFRTTQPNQSQVIQRWLKGDLLEAQETTGDDGSGTVRLLASTRYEYDEKGRRVREIVRAFAGIPAAGTDLTKTFFYDQVDRPVRVVDHRGGVTTFSYDAFNRVLASTDPMGNVDQRTYDQAGNLIESQRRHQEPDGSISLLRTGYGYDARNRRTATIAPDGSTATAEYDDRGLVVLQKDYLGVEKQIAYDSFQNRVGETQDAKGLAVVHQWQLDGMSRAVSYTDPTGQVSTYTWDGLGRLVHVALANGFTSTRTFNAAGQLEKEALGSGVVFEYGYDVANRLVTVSNSAAPAPIVAVAPHHYTWDGMNRLVRASAGGQPVVRTFDSLGRLLSEAGLGPAFRRAYTDTTGVLEKIWPDGRTERHSHDLNAALSRIDQTSATTVGGANGTLATFRRSGPRFIGQTSFGAATSVTNTFDDRKRLTDRVLATAGGGGGQAVSYRHDAANRTRVEQIVGANPKSSYFDFDAKYRLTEARDGFVATLTSGKAQAQQDAAIAAVAAAAAGASHREAFVYDAADARTKYSQTGNPDKSYTYQPGHRLQSDGTLSYSHHADGTARTAGPVSYDADAFGRIVAVRSGASAVCQIEYDALSRPVVVQQAGRAARSFHYVGDFVEQEDDGAVVASHVTLDADTGVPVARHLPGQRHYPVYDGRFNLIALADASGSLLETYRYQPFGAPRIFNAAGSPIPLSAFGVDPVFGGQRYLSSPALYLSTRRLMDPATGLFLSPDPNEYGDSPSLYVYAAQNPIDLVDPDGAWAVVGILVVMGIGALVAGGINAGRQGVQIIEGSKPTGFSGWELLESMLIGAVIAPALVFAPEAAVPLALAGVASGINEMKQGHIATGMFDIITALLPLTSKGGRASMFSEGSLFSGLSKGASIDTRVARFGAVEKGMGNLAPDPFGRDIGLGLVRPRTPGGMGHAAVVVEDTEGKLAFFEKNAQRDDHDFLVSDFNSKPAPLDNYFNGYALLPFEYRTIRISKANAQRALGYAQDRTSRVEPFDKRCANCANFASDVLSEAGLRDFGDHRPMKVWTDLINFDIARSMIYSTRAPYHPNDQVGSK